MRPFFLLLVVLVTPMILAQDLASKPVNVTTFSNRAVSYVITHTARNPGAFITGTEAPINLAGKWSIKKYGAIGCKPDAFGCVAVLYTPPSKDFTCEWTVQIDPDSPSNDQIVDLNADAARFYLIRLSPEEARTLSNTRTQPAFVFPAIARSANLSGSTFVILTLDTEGIVTAVRTLSGPPILRDTVEDTFRHWRFDPYAIKSHRVAAFAYAEVLTHDETLTMHFISSALPKHPTK